MLAALVLAVVCRGGEPDHPRTAGLAAKVVPATAAPVLPTSDKISRSLYRRAGCLDGPAATAPKACAFGDTVRAVRTVALVGDSAAGEWFDALEAIAVRRHWRLVTELHSGCPWTAAVMLNLNGVGTFTACHAWGAAVFNDLVATIRPDVVITSGYPTDMATGGHPVRESPGAVAEIGAGLAQYRASLEDAGIPVTTIAWSYSKSTAPLLEPLLLHANKVLSGEL